LVLAGGRLGALGAVIEQPPDLVGHQTGASANPLAAADGIVIPVTASVVGLHGLAGFRDWLASFRTDRIVTAPVWGVLLTQADLDTQGRMRTRVGRDVRDALADFRVTGARLLPVLVARRDGVEDLVSQRLLLGDPAAHAGPLGPQPRGPRNECRARRCRRAPAVGQRQLPGGRPG
jgi:hypothetical protein